MLGLQKKVTLRKSRSLLLLIPCIALPSLDDSIVGSELFAADQAVEASFAEQKNQESLEEGKLLLQNKEKIQAIPSGTAEVVNVLPLVNEQGIDGIDQSKRDILQHDLSMLDLVTTDSASQMQQTSEQEKLGFDTVGLENPQGNWLFKKIWWERAQELYEKVRLLVAQVMDSRIQFFMQRSEIDRLILDPFYLQVGVAQGQLEEIIETVLLRLEEEKNKYAVLDASERHLNNDVEATKETLERLKVDFKMIATIDHMIDDALEQLIQQINKVRSYEQEAWQSYKKIGFELSDNVARDLFYNLDMHMRYIKDIQRYLQYDFARHFQDLTQQVSTETVRLTTVINGLKEQGLDLKKQAVNAAQSISMNIDIDTKKIGQIEEEEEQPAPGFFAKTLQAGKDFFVNFFNQIKGAFVSSSVKNQESED